MRRLLAIAAIALQLSFAAPALAQNAAPDGVRVPDDCNETDLTVVCGLIPPWGNGEFVTVWSDVKNDAVTQLKLFPDNERPWRLCLKGAYGAEWSLKPCSLIPHPGDRDGFADFTDVCVGRAGVNNCLLGDDRDFPLPVHFVWNEYGIDVISEGGPIEYKHRYAVPDDCADTYTICNVTPPWGNTLYVERIVPFDRGEGFTLRGERVIASVADDVWRICTDPRLGQPLWSVDPCASLPDGAGDAARDRLERAEGMQMHEMYHGGAGHRHPHGDSSPLGFLLLVLLALPLTGAVAIVRVLSDREAV
jgi:hypothetical protein